MLSLQLIKITSIMFDNLSDKLDKALHLLKGHGKITDVNVADTLKEVRRALLDADVNFKIAKDFTTRVKEKAIGENVLTTSQPGQLMVKIVKDELTELMGGDVAGINLSGNPSVILMSGLQGSGKTTFSGKLANYLKSKQGRNPLLVAADVYRPAAMDQLQVLADQIKVPVYIDRETKDAVQIAKDAVAQAKRDGNSIVIIDTAGRLHNKINLMNELTKVKRVMQKLIPDAPHEVLLVLDGSTGQNAFEQAKQFTKATEVTCLAVTKLDGTAKGGVVIGISDQFQIPVKYIGVGEGIDDLQVFNKMEFVDSFFK